jgi:photosynthetic reaction center cytochrome c subunit
MKFARKRTIRGVATAVVTVWLLGGVLAIAQTAPTQTAPKPQATAPAGAKAAPAVKPGGPGAQMAEVAFKDVTVLKGISVEEFMDTMGFFAASLSWNCTDCHGDDAVDDWANFAKDTPKKTTARKMIQMVNALNKNNFAGSRLVTCYTCHRGDADPKITPSLVIQYTDPFEDPNEVTAKAGVEGLPTSDAIFAKYFQAIGGQGKVAALKSMVAKGTYSGYDTDNQKVPVDMYEQAPAQTAQVVHGGLGDMVKTFDGKNGWIASPDRPFPLIPVTGGDITGAKIDGTLNFPGGLKALFPAWRVAETVIGDDDVYMVEGVATGQLPLKLYFNEKTGLLVRALHLTNTVVGFNPTQLDFDDYREVPGTGVKVPFHRVVTWTDNQTTVDLSQVQGNAAIDAKKFAQPPPAPPGTTSTHQ